MTRLVCLLIYFENFYARDFHSYPIHHRERNKKASSILLISTLAFPVFSMNLFPKHQAAARTDSTQQTGFTVFSKKWGKGRVLAEGEGDFPPCSR